MPDGGNENIYSTALCDIVDTKFNRIISCEEYLINQASYMMVSRSEINRCPVELERKREAEIQPSPLTVTSLYFKTS